MGLRVAACLLLLLTILATDVAKGQSPTQAEAEHITEWRNLIERFKEPRSYNLMSSGIWTLIHASESKDEVEQLINVITSLYDPPAKQDQPFVNDVGGARGFKEKMSAFLTSKGDVVPGFAATILGISGDFHYAPAIARLLDKKDPLDETDENSSSISSRGRAAYALSLLGAREYVPRFVTMLESRNRYDRSGAIMALGELHATEHAKEVAAILSKEEFKFEDDSSPIYALVAMGVAPEHASEIAKVLQDQYKGEAVEAAAYALAKIGAKQYVADVAKLLTQEYRKGAAAKALAIMGAKEYEGEIAKMLSDESGLNRNAALLALGVMKSTKYVSKVAAHLKDSEEYVRYAAAVSLVLMDAGQYSSEIIPLVESAYQKDLCLTANEFDPLVEEQLSGIRVRFKESFLKMKARGK